MRKNQIKCYEHDTFNKQDDANCSDLDSELKDLNYKVGSLIFCHGLRARKAILRA